jgi:hypothetical protein
MAKKIAQRQGQPTSEPEQREQQEQGNQSSVATLEREPEQPAGDRPQADDIARRAYELYCERGCEHGRDMDDWLKAEYELKHDRGEQ